MVIQVGLSSKGAGHEAKRVELGELEWQLWKDAPLSAHGFFYIIWGGYFLFMYLCTFGFVDSST